MNERPILAGSVICKLIVFLLPGEHGGMRASRLGIHVGCALGTWTGATSFFVSTPAAFFTRSRTASTHVAVTPRGTSKHVLASARGRGMGACVGLQKHTRQQHRCQSYLFMSSNQGMNPDSFTERAWEAMGRLPAIADSNNAQVNVCCSH